MGHIARYFLRALLFFALQQLSLQIHSCSRSTRTRRSKIAVPRAVDRSIWPACRVGEPTRGVSARRGRLFSPGQSPWSPRSQRCVFSPEKLAKSPATAGKPGAAERASDAAASLVAPPRTISDIAAILGPAEAGCGRGRQTDRKADASGAGRHEGCRVADFVYQRAQARALSAG